MFKVVFELNSLEDLKNLVALAIQWNVKINGLIYRIKLKFTTELSK